MMYSLTVRPSCVIVFSAVVTPDISTGVLFCSPVRISCGFGWGSSQKGTAVFVEFRKKGAHLNTSELRDRRPSSNLIVLSRFNPKFRPISQSFSRVEIDTGMSPSICLHAERRKTAVNTAVWTEKAFAEDDEDEFYAAT